MVMPRYFKFASGRRDCIPEGTLGASYKTTKKEVSPDASANGQAALAYMKTHFGLNGRETVVLCGVSNLGIACAA